jgi:hypothetical protein
MIDLDRSAILLWYNGMKQLEVRHIHNQGAFQIERALYEKRGILVYSFHTLLSIEII